MTAEIIVMMALGFCLSAEGVNWRHPAFWIAVIAAAIMGALP